MEPFRWRRAFFVGIVIYAASIFAPVFDTFVPVLLQSGHPLWQNKSAIHAKVVGFALAPSLAFFIMTWDNLINLFVHPWAGARSDRTAGRWGRRKPWIVAGVPVAAVGFVAIPFAPSLWLVALAILVANIGRAIFVPPMIAWLGDLYAPDQRSQANSAFGLVSGLAAIMVLLGCGALFEQAGRAAPFIATAFLMVSLAVLGLVFVHEPPPHRTEPLPTKSVLATFRVLLSSGSNNWRFMLLALFLSSVGTSVIETGHSSFAVFELGMTLGAASAIKVSGVMAFILFALPSGQLAARLGRCRTVSLGLLIVILTYGVTYSFVTTPAAYAITLFVAGIGGALVLVNILPLVYDLGDEWHFGSFTGLVAVPVQSAAVIGPSVAGVMVEWGGSQRVLFLTAVVVLFAAWVLLQRVRLSPAARTGLVSGRSGPSTAILRLFKYKARGEASRSGKGERSRDA
jgi:maltose/moltooligosaccharide transporter